jgi:hypothetical protein
MMTTQIRHFVLTPDGRLREFSGEQAAHVATGAEKLPEFAKRRVRYLQLTVSAESGDEIRVVSAGASIRFDAEGRLTEAGPISKQDEKITHFEHDACVQWALRDLPAASITYH